MANKVAFHKQSLGGNNSKICYDGETFAMQQC